MNKKIVLLFIFLAFFVFIDEGYGSDLVITDIWNEDASICYQIRNIGNETAPEDHSTGLFIDDDYESNDSISIILDPGERLSRCFDYLWSCSRFEDKIIVSADYNNTVAEDNETNNEREETWKCDTTAPKITFGPIVDEYSENAAVIHWETDESSNSTVLYDKKAETYGYNESDPSLVTSHYIAIYGLEPSTTYQVKVESSDAAGNTVESEDIIFETLDLPDSIPPDVTIQDPGMVNGTVTISADAEDNIGIEKVEFYLDESLKHADYSPPYEWIFTSEDYDNDIYKLTSKAYDLSGTSSTDTINIEVFNIKDLAPPTVNITSYSVDNVSGTINITATLTDDVGIDSARLYVDGNYSIYEFFPTNPTNTNVTFTWEAVNETLDSHDFIVEVMDIDYKSASDDLLEVVVPESFATRQFPWLVIIDHRATRHENYFEISLTVKNVGTADAVNVMIEDGLLKFQPISKNITSADYFAKYRPNASWSSCEIRPKSNIHPGQWVTFSYNAVPILLHPRPIPPSIGNIINLEWESTTQVEYSYTVSMPIFQTTYGDPIPNAYKKAVKAANYLIVTSPSRLFKFANYTMGWYETNILLSTMAELAYLKKGVLGFPPPVGSVLRTLIMPTGEWAQQMGADFYGGYRDGYFLIVGETEIIPAATSLGWNIQWSSGSATTEVNYADQFYSDYNNNCHPDLIVGRIIGNRPGNLTNAIRTSINVYNGAPGYGFDYSDAILLSGTGSGLIPMVSAVNTAGSHLSNKGVNVAIIHAKDYRYMHFFLDDFYVDYGFATGDVLGDDKEEILVADFGTGDIRIFDGFGNPVFSFPAGYIKDNGFAVGDVLGDNKSEIVIADHVLQQINIFNSSGDKIHYFNSSYYADDGFAVGDVLGDNKSEIIQAFQSSGNIFIFNGSGHPKSFFYGGFYYDNRLATGDVIGDYKEELVTVDFDTEDIYVYSGNGTLLADFWVLQPGLGTFHWGFAVGDIWGDEKDDIITVDDSYEEKIWIYNGSGAIVSFTKKSGFSWGDGFAVGDVLGDNKDEFLRGDHGTHVIYVGDLNLLGRVFDAFAAEAPNKDIVYVFAHGNPNRAGGLVADWLPALNFGSANPIILATSCTTGDYEDNDDYNLAEAFLDRNAAIYIGATEVSPHPINEHTGKVFYDSWDPHSHSIGKYYTDLEGGYCSAGGLYEFWVYEYNLYGEPKFGSIPPSLPGSTPSSQFNTLQIDPVPPIDINITVPDYEVTTYNITPNYDYVEIPGGFLLLELNKSKVPFYYRYVDYPVGYKVQDVNLTDRSGLITDTGLNIPFTTFDITSGYSSGSSTGESSGNEDGWYPEKEYDWHIVENADGTTTLVIIMYPFYYNHLTTDVKFYKNYSFSIDYFESPAEITSLTTDKDEYEPNAIVMIDIEINNSEAQDIVVSTIIKKSPTDEIPPVYGLLLSTLTEEYGSGSAFSEWYSSGFEPGQYYVEVTLKDIFGNILDRTTKLFRLGISSGEVSLIAVPEIYDVGDNISLDMTFNNTGTVNITGKAVIKIFDSNGVVDEFMHNITDLLPSESINFTDIWSTTGAEEVSYYNIIGYVSYDSKTTDPESVLIQTDYDDDGVGDTIDNCFFVINPDQNDTDGSCSNFTMPYTEDPKCGDACLLADLNSDCSVDILDLIIIGNAFGSTPGQPNWNPIADLKQDGKIDVFDLSILGKNFGNSC